MIEIDDVGDDDDDDDDDDGVASDKDALDADSDALDADDLMSQRCEHMRKNERSTLMVQSIQRDMAIEVENSPQPWNTRNDASDTFSKWSN